MRSKSGAKTLLGTTAVSSSANQNGFAAKRKRVREKLAHLCENSK